MKPTQLLVVGIVFGLSVPAAHAGDWPQWRGPERNGISQEKGLLKEWPKEGPHLNWQVKDLGDGYSTPSIAGEHLYLISNKGKKDESAHALSVNDGRIIWSHRLGKVGVNIGPQYPGARSTPTIDGEMIYALGSDGDLACLDAKTGDVKWHKNLRSDFDGQPGLWAYAESPLIDGDALVCTPGGKTATIVALDKKTGKTIWKSPIEGADKAAYASAIVVTTGGVKQYVQFLSKGLVGVDAKTGKFLWRYDKTAKGSPANIPTAVAYQNYVYSATARAGGGLIALKTKDQTVEADPVYFNKKLPSAIGGAVEVEGFLYGTSAGGLQCVEFTTGKPKWQSHGVGAGSICYAEGRLYLHDEEKGDVALVECTSDGYHEKGHFSPPNPPSRRVGKAWSYPALADGRLYIYDYGTLWSYDVSGKTAAVETRVTR
jgi:outer membrane protein assembly factor BamB